jgi:hypothetical protein
LVTLCRVLGEFEFQLRDCSRMTGKPELDPNGLSAVSRAFSTARDEIRYSRIANIE